MSNLEELIERLCPDGVEYKSLEKCCEILDKKRKPVAKSARISGEYPYYGANGVQDYVSDYIFDGEFVLVGEDGSVITDKGTPVVTWASGKIWVNNHAHIISEINGVLLRYIYYYLQTVDVTIFIHGNIPKLTGKDFKSIKLPVPPLEVQREIVQILDNFTATTTELQQKLQEELAARQKQYEYHRDSLLTFENEPDGTVYSIPWFADILCKLYPEGVEYEEIGEIATLSAGGDVPKERFSKEKTEEFNIPIYSNGIEDKSLYGFTDLSKINDPCVTISARGTIGWAALRQESFYPIVRLICVIPKERILAKFLKYVIDTIEFKVPVTGIPQLTVPMVSKYKIPVPPLVVQQRIVDILDRFDALCNDISSGLPAEIEARQKQYEYYRDKLLTFKELKKEA